MSSQAVSGSSCRFAAALHARCLADPELNHPFSHPGQNPQHVERLAAYLAETMGGPPRYSGEYGGDQSGLLLMHAGNGDMSDLGRRFADCFMLRGRRRGLAGRPGVPRRDPRLHRTVGRHGGALPPQRHRRPG